MTKTSLLYTAMMGCAHAPKANLEKLGRKLCQLWDVSKDYSWRACCAHFHACQATVIASVYTINHSYDPIRLLDVGSCLIIAAEAPMNNT